MSRVIIRNPAAYQAKVDTLKKDGIRLLHCICDFDKTLSHPKSDSSWSLLKRFPFRQSFHDTCDVLFQRFHKVEVDSTKSIQERRESMDEWWRLSHELLIAQKVTKKVFVDGVAEFGQHMFFRSGTDKLLQVVKERQVPFLVLSAGLGDLIDAVVAREGWTHVHVVSNHLVFDGENGVATRFQSKNITTFTKNEQALHELHPDWEAEVRGRRNVILVGDSIGDSNMSDGMTHDCVLRIGFLNPGQENSLEEFCEAFDVVLQNDDSFDFLLNLLNDIK